MDFYDRMTAMECSISPYEERGSEASMTDSMGIKDAVKESSKGQTQMNKRKMSQEETQMELDLSTDPGSENRCSFETGSENCWV